MKNNIKTLILDINSLNSQGEQIALTLNEKREQFFVAYTAVLKDWVKADFSDVHEVHEIVNISPTDLSKWRRAKSLDGTPLGRYIQLAPSGARPTKKAVHRQELLDLLDNLTSPYGVKLGKKVEKTELQRLITYLKQSERALQAAQNHGVDLMPLINQLKGITNA